MIEIQAGQFKGKIKDYGEPNNEVWVRGPFGTIVFNAEDPKRNTPAEASHFSWQLPGTFGKVIEQIRDLSSREQLPSEKLNLLRQTVDYLQRYQRTATESIFAE